MSTSNAPPKLIRDAWREGMQRLEVAGVPSHALSTELLLMHVLQRDRAWLYAHAGDAFDPAGKDEYFRLLDRRAAGVPTQYLTGHQEFWGLEFEVTPAVLIPRPETEHVVEVALDRLADRKNHPLRIADVGTGSGCIAVALALELPHSEIFATDISAPALEVARRNAARHAVSDRIHFIEGDLLAPDSIRALRPGLFGPGGQQPAVPGPRRAGRSCRAKCATMSHTPRCSRVLRALSCTLDSLGRRNKCWVKTESWSLNWAIIRSNRSKRSSAPAPRGGRLPFRTISRGLRG